MSQPSIVSRACTSGALQERAAARAGTFCDAREETLEHRRELLLDIGELEELLVQKLPAALAVPLEAIELTRAPHTFDHQAHGVGRTLRGVRQLRRYEQHLAGADRHVHRTSVLHGPEHHVTFELVEELLAWIDVEVLARVRAAHHHDDEVAVAEYALVADRRPQLRAVGVDPLPQVECRQGLHVASVPPYVTRKGNEESDRCNPERRIPPCSARCCAPWR